MGPKRETTLSKEAAKKVSRASVLSTKSIRRSTIRARSKGILFFLPIQILGQHQRKSLGDPKEKLKRTPAGLSVLPILAPGTKNEKRKRAKNPMKVPEQPHAFIYVVFIASHMIPAFRQSNQKCWPKPTAAAEGARCSSRLIKKGMSGMIRLRLPGEVFEDDLILSAGDMQTITLFVTSVKQTVENLS